MTQTLRRELRKKFEDVLIPAYSDNPQTQEAIDYAKEQAEKCADAALTVAGIKQSANKFNDPYWDLLHGKNPEPTEETRLEEMYTSIAARLEVGLRRGEFPQSPAAQKIYKWIDDREQSGQSLDTWMRWAMEGRRAEFTFIYHQNPEMIKRDWLQVFASDSTQPATPDKDGGYR